MRPLWLDYRRPDPTQRRPGFLLLAVGAVAAVLTTADYYAAAAERDDAQAEVDRLRRDAERQRTTAAAAAASARAATREPARVAPSAQRWESLFAALEAAADDTVTLLTLHPGASEIQIGGEARDFASSLDYLRRLQAAPALANLRLTQSETVAENPHHPVRFSFVADWRSGP